MTSPGTSTATNRLERNLGLAALALLLLGCLAVLSPFTSALLWAVVLCFSSWPLYQRLLDLVRNRRTLAAVIMTSAIILFLLVPFIVIGLSLAENVKDLSAATRSWVDKGPPPPPEWLLKVPVVGDEITAQWKEFAGDSTKLLQQLKGLIEPASAALLKGGAKMGGGLIQMGLSVFIAFFLFRDGADLAMRLKAGIGKIAGERGHHLLELAGNTVRGVVYGILGTALVQGIVAGIGFVVAGVPGAAVLALLTFFASVVPMGPPLLWGPAAIWLFQQDRTGWAIFMVAWGFLVSSIDNVVKPWLISQGSAMPFILILLGVVGGAFAFGFVGVFLGPTLLAVGYRVIEGWTVAAPKPPNDPAAMPDTKVAA